MENRLQILLHGDKGSTHDSAIRLVNSNWWNLSLLQKYGLYKVMKLKHIFNEINKIASKYIKFVDTDKLNH